MTDRLLALVLTSDPHSIRVLQQTLPQFGLHVVIIHDGHEAVENLEENEPALVLLDLRLPHSFDILSHPHLTFTKVIILTSDVVCAHLTGRAADAELLQPVAAQDIIDTLRQMPEFAQSRG